MKPTPPMMMKAISQPICSASTGMVSGAARAPTEAPALKMEVARARSFLGKYSAVTLMAAGKLPASPVASTMRQERKSHTLMVEMVSARSVPALTARRASSSGRSVSDMVRMPHPACRQAPILQMTMAQM